MMKARAAQTDFADNLGAPAGPARARDRRRVQGALVFVVYFVVAVLYLGRRALLNPTGGTLGTGPDVQIFLWGLRWWPYALGHGLNPLFTRLVWPPGGIEVLWTTTVPALSLLVAPVTLTLGVAAAWNLLCVVAPAVSGWAAWLLCRELGARRWPSLLGGALFGFSSFEVAEGMAHLQLTMSMLIPLTAYTVIRHVSGKLGACGLVGRLAAITILQFLIAPELLVTMLIVAAVAAGAAILLMAERRQAILRTTRLAILGVAAGCVVLIPLLIAMLTHRPAQISAQVSYSADLLNLVIPTSNTALGGPWLTAITASYSGSLSEQCAYIGIPTLAIIIAFAIRERASPTARLLIVVLAASVIFSLGSRLTIDGRPTIWLPWALMSHLALVSDALPARFALYTALICAVITARWLSDSQGPAPGRWMLAALAVISLAPATAAARWKPTPTAITSPALDRLLAHQRVLSLPFYDVAERGLYAQAASNMGFTIIDSWMQVRPRDLDQFPDLQGPQLVAPKLARLQGERAHRFEHQLCQAHITRLLLWGNNPHLLNGLKLNPTQTGNALVYQLPRCLPPN